MILVLVALGKNTRIVAKINRNKSDIASRFRLAKILYEKYLILCGSSMSFMESQVLGKESPLYGRRTGQFRIEPLDYKETAVFHPDLSAEENSLIYGITGGVPPYINKLDVRDSVDEALLENFFDRSSYLYEEPGNLLKQELREPAIYNAIIKAIAGGASRMNDITMKVGEKNSVVSQYLKTLINLGIVKKETPITEKPGKKTIYLLLLCSCKYRNEKIGLDELELLRDYASVFGKGIHYHYYFFSKGGFTDGFLQARERGEVRLITLAELY